MVQRIITVALLAAALTAPATAGASEITTTRLCYLAGEVMVLSGSGFTPNAPLRIEGEGTTPLTGAADDSGAFTATLRTPPRASLGLTGMTPADLTLTATDTSSGDNASTVVSVALLGFHASGGFMEAGVTRTWDFSGWILHPRKAIYGHYRFGGKTVLNRRFGTPSGPCGTLTMRGPGIPHRLARLGTWRLQVDQNPAYNPKEKFASRSTFKVVPINR